MKEIPLLKADDIDVRIQSFKNNAVILLLYKDARVDMRILDEVFGVENWQRTHEVIAGNLFCNIDIWDESKHQWVRKQDVGTESNTEKEKGQASDSLKRAGTNVGIGRELYTAPFIYVKLESGEYTEQNGKYKSYAKFSVKDIGYNDRKEINKLVIVDNKGKERFIFGVKGKSIEPLEPTHTPTSQSNEKENYIKAVAIKANEKGWSNNDVSTLIRDNFQVSSSKELTLEQASKLLKIIDEM